MKESEEQQLSPQLEAIESRLLARRLPEPSPELRHQTLAAARAEFQVAARSSRWSLMAVVAAAALLLVNLSSGLFMVEDSGRRVVNGRDSIDATALQLRELLPELSEAEVRRSAITWQLGTGAAWSPGLAPDTNVPVHQRTIDSVFD